MKLGAKGLHDAPGGRKTGQGRTLDAAQELLVRQLIADKTPDQLKMPYALWTRAVVGQLIEQCFCIRLAVRTVGLYLTRGGFTSQKPMKKAYEQSRGACARSAPARQRACPRASSIRETQTALRSTAWRRHPRRPAPLPRRESRSCGCGADWDQGRRAESMPAGRPSSRSRWGPRRKVIAAIPMSVASGPNDWKLLSLI